MLPTDIELALYAELPADTGHFGVPYFHHVLRGLRRRPPDYLVEISAGGTPPAWLRERVAGVVLINVT